MVFPKIYELCRNGKSVTQHLVENPTMAPTDAAEKLFGRYSGDQINLEMFKEPRKPASEAELKQAVECGKFGSQKPSELFLRMYHDALQSLAIDPLQGMVSPSLMGSCGVVPLTIISTIPDICRHMANCIARAEEEVFVATNFWKHGEPTQLIVDGLRELSRRAGEKGERRVVKIMFDRGSPKQLWNNHLELSESEWVTSQVKIPPASEIPHLDLQVMNYHRPALGTFHPKFMVVDRRVAIVQSNNLQDNDNLEMMTHLEGPIVDSFYEAALLSWGNALKPPLPRLNSPAASVPVPCFEGTDHGRLFDESSNLKAATIKEEELPEASPQALQFDSHIAAEVTRNHSWMTPRQNETHISAATRVLNTVTARDATSNAPVCDHSERMLPYIPLPPHEPVPMAMVCRKPWGPPDMRSLNVPQNEAFLSAFRNAKRTVFIQTPNLNAKPLFEAITAACRRGVDVTYYVCLGYNDAGEMLPYQGGNNEMFANSLYKEMDESARKHLHVHSYVGKDQIQPIHNKFKKRSCHIKLLIVDSQVAIQGSGNQDTQTWFHSQEVNVMIDSPVVCAAWETALRRNQNTHLYGQAYQGLEGLQDHEGKERDMGCWYNAKGELAEGTIGVNPGYFGLFKGIYGAIQRVRGAAEFE